jgi:hypothetical protein
MAYQCVAASVEGFVQQVAVAYLARGYWFYVAGWIPAEKSPETVDAKLIGKYGVDVSRWERGRRKRSGLANMQYIRHGRFFLLMATHGKHVFFDEEEGQIRDARRTPVRFAGYSISYRGGHASVRIDQPVYPAAEGVPDQHGAVVRARYAAGRILEYSVRALRAGAEPALLRAQSRESVAKNSRLS